MGGIRKTLEIKVFIQFWIWKQTVLMLSSMFPFPLLLVILFHPLPDFARLKRTKVKIELLNNA
jgi:antibiotic biosynthesis monooxygenase (ABM) superfamily enzyme